MEINSRKLKSLRVEYGVKQEDIARIINIAVTTYNRKENGHSDFTLTEAKKIADYFDKPIEELFFKADRNAS
ncbi:MAG: helix-turn-helix transcriptional regulator [Firmicutes bacterium]|nr:helix-turn-helix transcriptional regulator [Bacillota bacterium]